MVKIYFVGIKANRFYDRIRILDTDCKDLFFESLLPPEHWQWALESIFNQNISFHLTYSKYIICSSVPVQHHYLLLSNL